MKNLGIIAGLIFFISSVSNAQDHRGIITIPLTKVLNPKEQPYDKWGVVLKNEPVENYFGNAEVEKIIEEKTQLKQSNPQLSKSRTISKSSLDIELGRNFRGAPKSGTPSDNGTDISKDGKIVHTINFDVQVKDDGGNVLFENSLKNFFGGKSGVFDPRVIYDHYEDRFIVVVLTLQNKELLVAFSQTNDPTGKWNLFTHQLSGSIDFPIIGINEHELVVTIINFGNSGGLFGYQISKMDGYAGKNIRLKEHKFDGSGVSIVTPANAFGTSKYGNKMYFIGINGRGGTKAQLYELTDTLGGNPQITKTAVTLPEEYSTGGKIYQKGSSKAIRIPNERFHNAIYHDGTVYGTFCTDVDKAGFHGLYYAKIDVENKTAEAYTFKKPQTDLVNPSLALLPVAGEELQMRAVLAYHETNKNMYPTLMAIVCDENGDWTEPLLVKEGVGSVGNADRLGDYTSCVTRFDQTPVAWLSGEYGGSGGRDNWIAEIKVPGIVSDNKEITQKQTEVKLGPNPVREYVRLEFNMNESLDGLISLYSLDGKLIKNLYSGLLKTGKNELYFNTSMLNRGTYLLKIKSKAGLITERIIKK